MKALKTKDPERSRKGRKAIVREAKYGRERGEKSGMSHTHNANTLLGLHLLSFKFNYNCYEVDWPRRTQGYKF